MSTYDKIKSDMKAAMKSRDKELLSTLRLIVSSIDYSQIDDADSLSDSKVTSILKTEAKKRREAIEAYEKAGREESKRKEEEELKVIESYLPDLMSEDEVREKVDQILDSSSFDSFGAAMGACMAALKGEADGSMVSKIVKQKFESK